MNYHSSNLHPLPATSNGLQASFSLSIPGPDPIDVGDEDLLIASYHRTKMLFIRKSSTVGALLCARYFIKYLAFII